jgi:hypothetical protein
MNDNLLYHPSDLDIGAVLREQADQLIKTLDIPEIEELLEDESEDLLDTVPALRDSTGISTPNSTELENLLEEQLHVTNSQLPTPSPTPSDESTHSLLTLSNDTEDGALPAAPGNRAHRGNEISGNFDPQNIIQGSRTRRSAYVAALGQTDKLVGYYASFSTAVKAGGMTKPPHRDTLPAPPNSWKQMLKHPHSTEFRKAADKEFNALLEKGTFEYIEKSKVDDEPLPLMWVFTYKFDQDGYLLKHKARLVARGDLQYTAEDTYAATLAAQTFRAIMAIVAAFGLKTRQYDAVNAFANALLTNPLACLCAEGYERSGFLLWVLRALYGLKTSPILWYKDFTNTLEDLGLNPVPETNCLFVND